MELRNRPARPVLGLAVLLGSVSPVAAQSEGTSQDAVAAPTAPTRMYACYVPNAGVAL
jgi:hypothetical protein